MSAQRIPCPNCLRAVSADLSISRSEKGFSKVYLGFQCKTCQTTYKPADFVALAARLQKVRVK
jgi:hypothetical protein